MPSTHMRVRQHDAERLIRFAQHPTGTRRVMFATELLSLILDEFEQAENGRNTRRAKKVRRKREKKRCAQKTSK